MRKFLFVAGIIISCSAFADNDTAQRVTSLDYVTTQIETRQTKFQQKGSDKIMTYTSTLGTPGERDIVSDLGQETDISNTNIPKVSAVNTKIELKQDKNKIGLPANTVLTNTNSAGNPGTKAIYDSSSTYATQSDALIEYDDFHTALTTAINSELQCTDSSCLLYRVFAPTQNLILPPGYTRLEYIGTNHDAYIMTDLTVNDFDRVTAQIKLYDNNTELNDFDYPHLFGVSADPVSGAVQAKVFRFYNPSVSGMYAAYNDKWAISWGGTWARQSVPLNLWHNFDVKLASGEQYIKMDNSLIASGTLSATLSNSYTLPIFAMNYAGDIKYKPHLDSKIIQFYLNGNLVRNFIPAKRNRDNEIGMYDLVSGTFYTNAGTGDFTAGPAVSSNLYIPQGNVASTNE